MTTNMTADLRKVLNEQLAQAVRNLTAEFVLPRLTKHGLDSRDFPLEDFLEHVLAKPKRAFAWESGQPEAETVVIDSDDMEAIAKEIHAVLKRGERIFREGVKESTKSLVRQLVKGWPPQEADNAEILFGFKKRLLLHWGEPLKLFWILFQCAEEIFEEYQSALMRSRAKKGIVLREVLLGLQSRTLRTSRAVLTLLENGLPDDAYARWRTLYELNVFATLIAAHGDEAARRYRDHELVDLFRQMKNAEQWEHLALKKGQRRVTKREKSRIASDYDAVLSVYGADFRHANAWASPFVEGDNRRPKFVDIEQAALSHGTVPPYKESSLQIHAGRLGVRGLGSSDRQIASGHSNIGLEIPLMHSALALMQTTQLLLVTSWRKDVHFMEMLRVLYDRIEAESRSAAGRLYREEMRLRNEEAREIERRRTKRRQRDL